jgi:peptidoglycan/LPS O-acetylase OafA/YrhL
LTIQERLAAISHKGPGFDRIRLIAATIVVFHHSSTYLIPQIAHDYLFGYSRGLLNFGLFAVNVFFALSGFLVTPTLLRTRDVLTFTVHRALRIMPALAASVFLAMFVTGPLLTTQPLGRYFSDPQTYRYSKNLVFLVVNTLPGVRMTNGELIIVNGALWTLYFEVLCYAALVLMSVSGILARRACTIAVFATAFAANALLWYVPSLHALIPGRIETFLSLFVYFACGTCLFRLADSIPWSAGVAAITASAIVIGLPLGFGVLVMPICLPYIVVYLGLSHFLGRAQYKNDYSYGIYIFHAQVLTFMLIMFPSLRNFFVMGPLIAFISLLIAMLSWTFIEAPALSSKKWMAAIVRENLHWMWLSMMGRARDGRQQPVPRPRDLSRKGVRPEGADHHPRIDQARSLRYCVLNVKPGKVP